MDNINTRKISTVTKQYNQEEIPENDEIFDSALQLFDLEQTLGTNDTDVKSPTEVVSPSPPLLVSSDEDTEVSEINKAGPSKAAILASFLPSEKITPNVKITKAAVSSEINLIRKHSSAKQINDETSKKNFTSLEDKSKYKEIMPPMEKATSDDEDSIPTTSRRTKRKFVLLSSDEEPEDEETEEDKLFIDEGTSDVPMEVCPNLPDHLFDINKKKPKIEPQRSEIEAELQYLRDQLDTKHEERFNKLELEVAKNGRLLRALQAQVRALRRNKSED